MDDQAHQFNLFIENRVESVNINLKQKIGDWDFYIFVILFLLSTIATVFFQEWTAAMLLPRSFICLQMWIICSSVSWILPAEFQLFHITNKWELHLLTLAVGWINVYRNHHLTLFNSMSLKRKDTSISTVLYSLFGLFQNCTLWRLFMWNLICCNWFYFLLDDALVSSCRLKTYPSVLLWQIFTLKNNEERPIIKGWRFFLFCDFIQQGWYLITPSLS